MNTITQGLAVAGLLAFAAMAQAAPTQQPAAQQMLDTQKSSTALDATQTSSQVAARRTDGGGKPTRDNTGGSGRT